MRLQHAAPKHRFTTPPAPSYDVRVAHSGSISLVTPLSTAAREWVRDNVETEGWQWLGGALAVEPRYVDNLLHGMEGAGLTVE